MWFSGEKNAQQTTGTENEGKNRGFRRGCSPESESGMKIYVGNMPYAMTAEELKVIFEAFGTVDKANIATDRETNRPRGFGFVEMPDNGQANAAVAALNGSEQGGRRLVVNEARPREDRPRREFRPRDDRGGFRREFRPRDDRGGFRPRESSGEQF